MIILLYFKYSTEYLIWNITFNEYLIRTNVHQCDRILVSLDNWLSVRLGMSLWIIYVYIGCGMRLLKNFNFKSKLDLTNLEYISVVVKQVLRMDDEFFVVPVSPITVKHCHILGLRDFFGSYSMVIYSFCLKKLHIGTDRLWPNSEMHFHFNL